MVYWRKSTKRARPRRVPNVATYKRDECARVMDRDVNGAKNIFLKNFEALGLCLALGPYTHLKSDFLLDAQVSQFRWGNRQIIEDLAILEVWSGRCPRDD